MMPTKTRDRRIVLAFVLLLVLPLPGYKIRPQADVHETMTRAAKVCADRALENGTRPADCYPLMNRPRHVLNVLARAVRRIGDSKFPELEQASRWPDVPAGANASALVDFAVRCKNRIEERGGLAHINNGLLCNSHYGSMQFFHAQASDSTESAVVTHDKIMGWAGFLFDMAVGGGEDPLGVLYCDQFDGGGAFENAMLPEEGAVPCMERKDGPWRLTDLFTMECRNPFDAEACAVDRSPDAREIARIKATGAILHLIQDSYSQSHAQRGEVRWEDGKVVSEVVCLPITQFTNYVLQDDDEHGEADLPPTLHPSCGRDTGIDDAVTASARALWHIDRARADGGPATAAEKSAFMADLTRVFSTREWIAANANRTGAGDCCRKGAG